MLACIIAGCGRQIPEVTWTVGKYSPEHDAVEYTFTINGLPAEAREEGCDGRRK